MVSSLARAIAGVAIVVAAGAVNIASASTSETVSAKDLDTPGAAAIRKLPKDFVNAPQPKRFSLEAKRNEDEAAKRGIDEIVVTGQRDPEDVISKRSAMAAFRQQLERDKTATPKQIAQMALCMLGLCSADYGPEGIPVENTAYSRGERGAKKTVLEQSLQFRGTYQ